MIFSISIIIPLYNKESSIRETLLSVLEQDYPSFEVVVVDDGSTDGSAEVVKEFCKDSRVKYYRIDNSGPSAARSHGVGMAQGEFILFLDADDLLMPGALSLFGNAAESHPDYSVFVANHCRAKGGKTWLYSEHYKEGPVRDSFKDWFMGILHPCAGTLLTKKGIWKDLSFSNELRRNEDIDLLFKLFQRYPVFRLSAPSMTYRLDESSASRNYSDNSKDYLGHLVRPKKGFWHRVSLYQLVLEAFYIYGDKAEKYSSWRSNLRCRIEYAIAVRIRLLTKKLNYTR